MEPRRQSCRPWSLAATPGWDGRSCRGHGLSPPARAGLRVGTSSLRHSQPGLQDAGLWARGVAVIALGTGDLLPGLGNISVVPTGHRISQTCVTQSTENLSLPRPARGWCCVSCGVCTRACVSGCVSQATGSVPPTFATLSDPTLFTKWAVRGQDGQSVQRIPATNIRAKPVSLAS